MMPTLIISLILFVIFLSAGIAVWIVAQLFRRKPQFGAIFKKTTLSFCITLPLFLFISLPILFSEMVSRASSRPQDRSFDQTPFEFGSDFKPVAFQSRDHLEIQGWYLTGSGKPAFILAHGLFRSRNEMLERGCKLNQIGYPVLLLDLRSHGMSEKAPITLGIEERMDILGACDFLEKDLGLSHQVLYGVSMGAVASLLAASEKPDSVKAVIADSPYDSLRNSVSKHVWLFLRLPGFPFSDIFMWNLERRGDFKVVQFNPIQVVQKPFDTPILFIFGKEDERMDSEVAEALFSAAASPQKELHFIDQAGHGAAFRTDPETCLSLIQNFVDSLPETD